MHMDHTAGKYDQFDLEGVLGQSLPPFPFPAF
jgi:hypothetical protein